jgi:hypothetical protein
MSATQKAAVAAIIVLFAGIQPNAWGTSEGQPTGVKLKPKLAPTEPEAPTRLQAGAVVYQQRDPYLEVWRASQLYRQGAYALAMQDPRFAAECFKGSGDAFEASIGEGRFLAESRFAEAQSRRLMGQIPQSARLFQISADIFRRTDPYNPYLIAALQNLQLFGYADKQIKAPRRRLRKSRHPPNWRCRPSNPKSPASREL